MLRGLFNAEGEAYKAMKSHKKYKSIELDFVLGLQDLLITF